MTNGRIRNFVFTINNWNDSDIDNLKKLKHSYLIYGREIGANGTAHLQGYCELLNQTRFNTIKEIIPNAHIENRKGTAKQASDYCKKDNDFTETGEISKQGKRPDIEATYDLVEKKASLIEFKNSRPNLQCIKIFEWAKNISQEDRNFKPEVVWLWGSTGTGKTRYVREKETDLWVSGRSLKWWDGYDNQDAVLIDDFRKDFCTFHELLRILDRYPYNVEVKGGHKKLNSKRIYITSCYPPHKVYDTREDVQQLLRRIDNIVCMDEL